MPEISVHIATSQPAAPPVTAADTPVTSEGSSNNQSFNGVLRERLGDKPVHGPAEESGAATGADPALPPVLAVDGKELPPDIAALIAASQPVVSAPTVDPAVSSTEATPDAKGEEAASTALATVGLPAAWAVLRTQEPDSVRATRASVDGNAALAPQGVVTRDRQNAARPVLEAVPPRVLSFPPGEAAALVPPQGVNTKGFALPEMAVAKDIVAQLADSRNATPPIPTTATLTPATGVPSSTTTPPAIPSTPLPFAQPGWEQGLGNRVMWMVNQQVQTAELRMNPAHLGPLEVRISIRDDQATISFVSAHGQVRDALQAAIPHLREMLGDNGLNLSNVDIAQHSFADTRQRPDNPQTRRDGGQGEATAGETHSETLHPVGRLGLVDDYA